MAKKTFEKGEYNEDTLFSPANSLLIGDSIPTDVRMTYRKGDVIINIGPKMETEPMYICVKGGNPGLWISIGGGSGSGGGTGRDGKSAYEIAVENGFKGTVQEWLKSLQGARGADGKDFKYEDFTPEQLAALKGAQGEQGPKGETGPQGIQGPAGVDGKDGTFDPTALFNELLTNKKDIIGAINELYRLIKNEPVEPTGSLIYYGYIPYEVTGILKNGYSDITLDMIKDSRSHMKSSTEKVEGKINIGDGIVPEACYMVMAVSTSTGIICKKDDGFGGKVNFLEDGETPSANGLDVTYDGVQYKLYGELALVSGERFVYMI